MDTRYKTIDEIIHDMKKWQVEFTIIDGRYEERYCYDDGKFYKDVEDMTEDYHSYTVEVSEDHCRKALSTAKDECQRVYAHTVFIINE